MPDLPRVVQLPLDRDEVLLFADMISWVAAAMNGEELPQVAHAMSCFERISNMGSERFEAIASRMVQLANSAWPDLEMELG